MLENNVIVTTALVREVKDHELAKVFDAISAPENKVTEGSHVMGASYVVLQRFYPKKGSKVMRVAMKNDALHDMVSKEQPIKKKHIYIAVSKFDRFTNYIQSGREGVVFTTPTAIAKIGGLPDIYVSYKKSKGPLCVFAMSEETLQATLAPGSSIPQLQEDPEALYARLPPNSQSKMDMFRKRVAQHHKPLALTPTGS